MALNRREHFRVGLHTVYATLYDELCSMLPQCWQPIAGFRSFQEQTQLYAKGRTTQGPIVTRAKAGFSFHNYGLATDWGYFTSPKNWIALKYDDARWVEYDMACNKLGLRTLNFEKPHNEFPLGYSIDNLFMAYENKGSVGVDEILKYKNGGYSCKQSLKLVNSLSKTIKQ